jgi:hypothetical protein
VTHGPGQHHRSRPWISRQPAASLNRGNQSLPPPNPDRRATWERMGQKVASLTDGLGMHIDPGIRDAVTALRLLSLRTGPRAKARTAGGLAHRGSALPHTGARSPELTELHFAVQISPHCETSSNPMAKSSLSVTTAAAVMPRRRTLGVVKERRDRKCMN